MPSLLGPAATGKARRPSSNGDGASLIPHIRALATTLQDCDADQLAAEARSLRAELAGTTETHATEVLVAGIALSSEALRRALKIDLYDVQLLAVVNLVAGRIAQMATGEGKTFVAIATATHLALEGRGVHVMTPNNYLAERDCDQARPVLEQLGMTTGLTPDQGQPDVKRRAYDCDVTYGTGHEFGFDYLRDQLTLRQHAAARLGERLLHDLRSDGNGGRVTIQRGLIHAVVDEADSVLIDDAGSPLVLSMAAQGTAPDLAAHVVAGKLSDILEQDTHFRWDRSVNRVSLTTDGMNRCYEDDVDVPVGVLMRPWTAYVEQALRAKYIFRRGVHYVLDEDEVRIVDETTGRIFTDRSWQDGLHQAIEAREGVPVTPEKESLAQITRQRFFRLYRNLCGMTGTAVGCEREFQHVYRSHIAEVPLRRPSARNIWPMRAFSTRAAKFKAIGDDIRRIHAEGRPVLVGTQSIADSEAIAAELNGSALAYQLLNGLQTAEEADVIAEAGHSGAITISTNLAGRGTDISIAPNVLELGGLHVIVAECQLSGRMDRQLVGRAGRQGNPGSAQTFVSAEDQLIVRYGPWLARAIVRDAGHNDETTTDFAATIRRIQETAEKQQFHGRAELLRQDIARDSLLGNE